MKRFSVLVAAAILPSALAQQWSCLSTCTEDVDWNDRDDWRGRGSGAFCGDDDFIEDLTECIATSKCSDADKSTLYQTIAQGCANNGVFLPQPQYASISATSGAPWPTAAWSSLADNWASGWTTKTGAPFPGVTGKPSGGAPWGGPGHWGGEWGPFLSGAWGPFRNDGSWTTGAWTSWWNGTACPSPDWAGWTEGPWTTNAEWTTWTDCIATTTATSVVTTTSGSAVDTSTSFGVRVAQAVSTDTSGSGLSVTDATPTGGAAGRTRAAGGLAVAALGAIVLL
ncbi:hypothetical protein P152DRAFT_237527 [Eremomyces bilateralis CBS 781.70]|uniref:Extracellular membrane protein CFEM domain-containing protein n=1 Tax=Eremomyces bilateralis CBS 781.70 TaxID=1392243 RepID=A0A6G1GA39_9PEZI|nr:uncharacterized protein P152DRAFT_237527 [Eremomyces bilateralis CBS 781.70]KAF1814903.1 hypothetical protein P152DRAFT_237527 [Eremomyces bilateralis CBS 781.70]